MFDLDEFFTEDTVEYMTSADMAEVICNDCLGCKNCCRELSAAITLDAWDVALLKEGLDRLFDEMIADGSISLAISDGVLLPIFGNKKDAPECVFLGEDGRCTIHPYRAGICRMYPLARRWRADGSFAYYLQKNECPNRTGEAIQISEWLGYEDIRVYEQTIKAYRQRLNEYRRMCAGLRNAPEKLYNVQQRFFDENFR